MFGFVNKTSRSTCAYNSLLRIKFPSLVLTKSFTDYSLAFPRPFVSVNKFFHICRPFSTKIKNVLDSDLGNKKKIITERKGRVVQIIGSVVDVEFEEKLPQIHNIIQILSSQDSKQLLEVTKHIDENTVRCISLFNNIGLSRGDIAIDTESPLTVPVGREVLGRVINPLGDPMDQRGPIISKVRLPIHDRVPPTESPPLDVLVTGIKIIDLLFPCVRGGRNAIFGGAGVGRSSIQYELINNVAKVHGGFLIQNYVGGRTHDINEWYTEFVGCSIIRLNEHDTNGSKAVFVCASMSDPPGYRARATLTSATIAEYFRDVGEDVMLFTDDIYRSFEAESELSGEEHHAELSGILDRLVSTNTGSISSVQTVYLPADDLKDPTANLIYSKVDNKIVLSRSLAEKRIFPSIDPFASSSSILTPEKVGEVHHNTAIRVLNLLQKLKDLQQIVSIHGSGMLSKEDRIALERAKKAQNFLTQPFAFCEWATRLRGQYVVLKDTIETFKDLLDGKLDHFPEEAFYMVGGGKEIQIKANAIANKKLYDPSQTVTFITGRRKKRLDPEDRSSQKDIEEIFNDVKNVAARCKARQIDNFFPDLSEVEGSFNSAVAQTDRSIQQDVRSVLSSNEFDDFALPPSFDDLCQTAKDMETANQMYRDNWDEWDKTIDIKGPELVAKFKSNKNKIQ